MQSAAQVPPTARSAVGEKLLKGQPSKTLDEPLPRRPARSAALVPQGLPTVPLAVTVALPCAPSPPQTGPRAVQQGNGGTDTATSTAGRCCRRKGSGEAHTARGDPLTGSQVDGASGRQLTWGDLPRPVMGTMTSREGNGVSGTEEEVPPFQGSDTAS